MSEPLHVEYQRRRPEFLRAYRNAPAELRDQAEAHIGTLKEGVRADMRAELGCCLLDGGPEEFSQRLADAIESHARYAALLPQLRRERAEREAKRLAEREQRREAHLAKLAEARAAIERGEPVPARLRPVGGRCVFCRRRLRDPESVRIGVGPECRRPLK